MTSPDLTAGAGGAGSGADPAGPPADARPHRSLLLGLAAAAVALAVALGVLSWLAWGRDDTAPAAATASVASDSAREQVLRAASQSALNLTSIDNAEFDEDVQRVLEGATGAFRTDFETRSKDLKEVLTENKVVSEGKVVEAAVVEIDEAGTATALVVVDSNVRNTAVPEGRVNTYRMKLQLERVDGQWLTSQLEFVG